MKAEAFPLHDKIQALFFTFFLSFSPQKYPWISCLRCQHLSGWMSEQILWTQILCLLCNPFIVLTSWPHSHKITGHILHTCTYRLYAMCLYILYGAWVMRNSNNLSRNSSCAINLNFFSKHIFVWFDIAYLLYLMNTVKHTFFKY